MHDVGSGMQLDGERQLAQLTSVDSAACLGLGLSVLHSLAPVVCMYTLWEIEKRHRGQFAVASLVHAGFDMINDLMLSTLLHRTGL